MQISFGGECIRGWTRIIHPLKIVANVDIVHKDDNVAAL